MSRKKRCQDDFPDIQSGGAGLGPWDDRASESGSGPAEVADGSTIGAAGWPLGTDSWKAGIATRLVLNITLQPRGRPRKAPERSSWHLFVPDLFLVGGQCPAPLR